VKLESEGGKEMGWLRSGVVSHPTLGFDYLEFNVFQQTHYGEHAIINDAVETKQNGAVETKPLHTHSWSM
jgi:hypothetical protein